MKITVVEQVTGEKAVLRFEDKISCEMAFTKTDVARIKELFKLAGLD